MSGIRQAEGGDGCERERKVARTTGRGQEDHNLHARAWTELDDEGKGEGDGEGPVFHRDARERKSRRVQVSGEITRWTGTCY